MGDFGDVCRQFGQQRLQLAAECQEHQDWPTRWSAAAHPYPFEWGTCWQAVIEFGVADFEAELGFYLDVLGLDLNALWDDHAMLLTPDHAYGFTIYRAAAGQAADPATLNLQFMLGNIEAATASLQARGVPLATELVPEWGEGNSMRTTEFDTPCGYRVKVWGFAQVPVAGAA